MDNSPIENFFGKMKNEMLFFGRNSKAVEDYIYYTHERITTKLKGLTPVEYRNQSLLIDS